MNGSWGQKKQGKQFKFISGKLSFHQVSLFFMCVFFKKPVVLSGEFVPLDWFPQTRCTGMLIRLIHFFRQTVIRKRELVPLELFRRTSCFILLFKILHVYGRILTWNKVIDTARGEFLFMDNFFIIPYPLMRFPYMEKVLTNTCSIIFIDISFSMLRSSWFNIRVYFTLFC